MVHVSRRIALTFALLLVGLAASAGALGPVAADVDDFTFDSLDVDYTLTRAEDGTSRLRVVETFVAVFPDADQNRGVRRAIPTSYNGQPLNPRLISITDEAGVERPAESDSDDGVFEMVSRADDYLRGEQTFVFTYDLENVTWTFDDGGQEFYWDVNGVDWLQPFGEVTATLHMDADLAGALTGRQSCYVGDQGVTQQCEIQAVTAEDGSVTVTADAVDLAPYETMTIAVGFDPDTFVLFDSSYFASGWGWAQAASALGMAGAFGFAVWTRRRWLRDAPGRPTVIAEFTPPPGVDALESAVMLGKTSKAIPAEVLEQAIVGSLRIVEGSKRAFGGSKLQVELVDRSRADRDGRMLLDGLFGKGARPGATFEFGKQDTRLSGVASKILKAAGVELKKRGVYRSVPGRVRTWPAAALFAGTVLVILFGMLAIAASVNVLVPLVLMVVAGIVLAFGMGLVFHRPLTDAGAELRDHLAGLKIFIDWAEADRIRMLQSPMGAERRPVDVGDPRQMIHLYETLLPYAVVFGQEKKWADELMVYYGDAGVTPSWYYGSAAFNAAAFSSSIASLSSAAMSSSSTSGGSSGGGSAGGGGGGGGGGGV
ncbi:DUF2207 domain-containing protein [Microbacterium sp. zg-Y818]|uniref:DUF2207 domain-containing protein n=1 Tax=unclassified Microbacterium TaxID=2609290 RepID=UPI00214C2DDD|nr:MULTISPECIES: DUF2207 domain-containing protein [unclassified Microbacterium]MCR2799990.1 DUF2207 domain-containing protein [Microbacterium sp. zg.Y818]WIM21968.1 DUF2207 domain-containing protein [Microbacterium sp. zg-Y818]